MTRKKKKTTTASPVSVQGRKRYRYVMKVVEDVEYSTAIESDKKLSHEELKDIAERRRVEGRLSFMSVANVDIWCDEAYDNMKEMRAP